MRANKSKGGSKKKKTTTRAATKKKPRLRRAEKKCNRPQEYKKGGVHKSTNGHR